MKRVLVWGVAFVLGVIVLSLIALLVAGRRQGAGRNSAAVEINKPAAAVFPFLSDLNAVKSWAGWSEVHLNTAGQSMVGSQFRVVVVNEGSRVEMDGEVTALEPNRFILLVLKSTKPPYRFTENARFQLTEETPGKTRVEVSTDTKYEGALTLMEPLISMAAQKRLDADVLRLKAMAEK